MTDRIDTDLIARRVQRYDLEVIRLRAELVRERTRRQAAA